MAANANGSWDADGTFYVNVTSSLAFTTVVVDDGASIFEFDNVAYNAFVPSVSSVPEPSQAALVLAGLLVSLGSRAGSAQADASEAVERIGVVGQ